KEIHDGRATSYLACSPAIAARNLDLRKSHSCPGSRQSTSTDSLSLSSAAYCSCRNRRPWTALRSCFPVRGREARKATKRLPTPNPTLSSPNDYSWLLSLPHSNCTYESSRIHHRLSGATRVSIKLIGLANHRSSIRGFSRGNGRTLAHSAIGSRPLPSREYQANSCGTAGTAG